MHSSPNVVNDSESELEIADNESVTISDQHMLGSSCSNTTSGLHTQHEPSGAAPTPADNAQVPTFPLYSLLVFSYQKQPLVIELDHLIQHDIEVMGGLSILSC